MIYVNESYYGRKFQQTFDVFVKILIIILIDSALKNFKFSKSFYILRNLKLNILP